MLNFGIYNFDILVTITENIADRILKSPLKNIEPTENPCFVETRGNIGYIYLKHDSGVGTVAHESWHAVKAMLDYIGVDDYDSEVVAYHLDFLVDKIWNQMNRKSK